MRDWFFKVFDQVFPEQPLRREAVHADEVQKILRLGMAGQLIH